MTALAAAPARRSPLERRSVFLVLLALIIGASLLSEFRSYARPDTGFLLDAAERVLGGARLYVDVVEINPPLIVVLNVMAVLAARVLHLSDILAYRLGFTAALLGALVVAGWLLRRLLPEQVALRRLLLLLLAFVLFPLGGQDYGEREHLVLALLVPYLLLAATRIVGRPPAGFRPAALGLLAGFAFALKPHFLVVWIGVEAFLRLTGRVRPGAVLPETATIAGFLAGYGFAVVAFVPQYFALVRLLAGPYGHFLYDPFWHVILTGPGAVLALFALLAFVALRPRAGNPDLWAPMALGTLGCLIAGAAQQKGLRYHFYPAFGLATLVFGLIVADVRRPLGSLIRTLYRRIAAGVLIATVALVWVQNATVALRPTAASSEDQFDRLLALIRSRGSGQRVYVMSYHIGSAYPLINYAGARSASRFPQLWILPAEYLDALKSAAPMSYRAERAMSPSERYLNRAVLEDLGSDPDLLIVFRHARDLPINGLRRLDYVGYFSRDPRIARLLAEYQQVAELPDYLVYQRVPPGAARSGPPPGVVPGTQDVVGVMPGSVRLRLLDPNVLIAVLAFLATVVVMTVVERGTGGGSSRSERSSVSEGTVGG